MSQFDAMQGVVVDQTKAIFGWEITLHGKNVDDLPAPGDPPLIGIVRDVRADENQGERSLDVERRTELLVDKSDVTDPKQWNEVVVKKTSSTPETTWTLGTASESSGFWSFPMVRRSTKHVGQRGIVQER